MIMKNFSKRYLTKNSPKKHATLKGSDYISPPPVGSHHSVKDSFCEAECLAYDMVTRSNLIGIEAGIYPAIKTNYFKKFLKFGAIFFIGLIRIYQNSLRFAFPSSCRFYPSCSEYSIEALKKFGVFKGLWLSVKRLVRCNPFNPGGYDPLI